MQSKMKNHLRSLVFALTLASPLAVVAQPAAAPGGAMIPIDQAQRILHFPDWRVTHTTSGVVLVCPMQFDSVKCRFSDKDESKSSPWIPLHSLSLPGYRISGVQFFSAGSSAQSLKVYFTKN